MLLISLEYWGCQNNVANEWPISSSNRDRSQFTLLFQGGKHLIANINYLSLSSISFWGCLEATKWMWVKKLRYEFHQHSRCGELKCTASWLISNENYRKCTDGFISGSADWLDDWFEDFSICTLGIIIIHQMAPSADVPISSMRIPAIPLDK